MSSICAIHQPNFFPWCGYFDKIARADTFVILDAVDYPRAGSGGMGSWSNRVKLDINGEPRWFGVPMVKQTRPTPILDSWIADDGKWPRKAVSSLRQAYAKAPRVKDAMALIEPLLTSPERNIARYNTAAIKAISAALGFETRFVLQSTLATSESSTDLLIEITRAVGCDTYLAGGGASGYQEDEKFAANSVALVYQQFSPFPYGNPDRFQPGLSIIDFLMHAGDWKSFGTPTR